MESRRRLTSLIAIVVVMWTALWPLVASLEARISGESMPLCHQAGMQVAPGEMPQGPTGPARDGKTHCPLCIMAFFAAFAATPLPPTFEFSTLSVRVETHGSPFLSAFEFRLPPSHAPPSSVEA